MDPRKLDEVRGWLTKARAELDAARFLPTAPVPHLDVAVYHCQQAAEKALKGFLVAQDTRFARTHDLRVLIEMVMRIKPELSVCYDPSVRLTPYATAFRYPGVTPDPERAEFDAALRDADAILTFITAALPPECR